MANFNSDYLIDKIEEQEEIFLTKVANLKERNARLMDGARELYECLLDRIGTSETTERERRALEAFTSRDNA